MNSTEAYELLGLQIGATPDEVKSAFRKQAAKLHPDVNKSPTAEADFKKLNEAHQLLTNPQPQPIPQQRNYRWSSVQHGDSSHDFDDINNIIYQVFRSQNPFVTQVPLTEVTLTFQESILGCEKEMKIGGAHPCSVCMGRCYIQKERSDSKCKKCNGNGHRSYGGEKELPCTTCRGTGKEFDIIGCEACKGVGRVSGSKDVKVKIGPGIVHGSVLSVNGVNIKFNVTPHQTLTKSGMNVVSAINISLLEALKGTIKEVETVSGIKSLKIKGPRRHMDQVVANGLGVPPDGNHIFILNVEYPNDIESLVKALEDKQNSNDQIEVDVPVENVKEENGF